MAAAMAAGKALMAKDSAGVLKNLMEAGKVGFLKGGLCVC